MINAPGAVRLRRNKDNLEGWQFVLQFRIQFLDGNASVILDLIADARNAVGAIALVSDIDWPPRAVTMRVLDLDGREVHSAMKGDSKRQAVGATGAFFVWIALGGRGSLARWFCNGSDAARKPAG